MPQKTNDNLDEFQEQLEYRFKSIGTLRRALTHASVRASQRVKDRNGDEVRYDYERLEFLGDRVLGLVIAELLWEEDLSATEGDLARRYNRLVRKESCAMVAVALDIGSRLILSASEDDNGGRQKETILGDACEGLLGALFVDGGYEVARVFIRKHWAPLFDLLPENAVDPKSRLQELVQGRGLSIPVYEELARSGPDHKPLFTSRVSIDGGADAMGQGASKRAAEQAAARALLVVEGAIDADSDE